jgi:hypothetical protein
VRGGAGVHLDESVERGGDVGDVEYVYGDDGEWRSGYVSVCREL